MTAEQKMKMILNRIDKMSGCDLDDLEDIAMTCYSDISNETLNRMEGILFGVLKKYGERIDEYDPQYPNNPYKFGYHLGDADFWTGYTGIADKYWGDHLALVERGCYAFGLEELKNCEDVKAVVDDEEEETIIIDEDGTTA